MRKHSFLTTKPEAWGKMLLDLGLSWWSMFYLGAIALVMALSPSSYYRANRAVTSRYIYTSTWQVLPWFTMLSALVCQVIIHIVVVTAISYGLSQYALEMVVRVLVLELIPLSAALFVALRSGLAFDASTALPSRVEPDNLSRIDIKRLRNEFVPQVIASAFAVISLAMISSVIVLILAYINVYGFLPWGLVDYTRTVGRVFDPIVTIGFALKTLLFGLSVAVIPMAALLEPSHGRQALVSTVQPGAIRLLIVLLLIEAGSLAFKYS
ncbi:MAG: ABC transporter permease [Oxalobacteraceae bacterium]|nr:ABC transporter permease [Oxalobacteraceae bacterium]